MICSVSSAPLLYFAAVCLFLCCLVPSFHETPRVCIHGASATFGLVPVILPSARSERRCVSSVAYGSRGPLPLPPVSLSCSLPAVIASTSCTARRCLPTASLRSASGRGCAAAIVHLCDEPVSRSALVAADDPHWGALLRRLRPPADPFWLPLGWQRRRPWGALLCRRSEKHRAVAAVFRVSMERAIC